MKITYSPELRNVSLEMEKQQDVTFSIAAKMHVEIPIVCTFAHSKQSYMHCTIHFLNIRTPKKCVVITLKVEQDGFSLE